MQCLVCTLRAQHTRIQGVQKKIIIQLYRQKTNYKEKKVSEKGQYIIRGRISLFVVFNHHKLSILLPMNSIWFISYHVYSLIIVLSSI